MKKSKVLLLAALVLCLAFLAISCSRTTPQQKEAESYFPLKAGNTWAYDADIGGRMHMEIVFKVTGAEKINGKDTFVYEGSADGKVVQKEYFESNKDALVVHRRVITTQTGKDQVIDLQPPETMLQFPLTPGKTWTWKGKVDGKNEGTSEFKVVGEEDVETPAGKFKAMKVDIVGKVGQQTINVSRWFAKGIGMVKEASTSGPITFTATLKGYTVDGKTVGNLGGTPASPGAAPGTPGAAPAVTAAPPAGAGSSPAAVTPATTPGAEEKPVEKATPAETEEKTE